MPRKKKNEDLLEVKFDLPCNYTVRFTRDVFGDGNAALMDALAPAEGAKPRLVIVADRAVVEGTPELGRKIGKYLKEHGLELAARPYVVNGGEINKTNGMTTVRLAVEMIVDAKLSRNDYLLAIGGGAILDAASYAAATVNRGVRIVRMPTTLLAQASASAYPAAATNVLNRKDASAVFAPPFATIIDFDFLKTQPAERRREGVAAAVKIAAVKDAKFLDWINKNAETLAAGDAAALEELVRKSAALHVETLVKSKQPCGPDAERVLEFGYWCTHRMEALGRFRVPHGLALAIGICVDTAYAAATGLISEDDNDLVGSTLARSGALNGLESCASILGHLDELLQGIEEFTLHVGGLPVFPGPLGKVHEVDAIDQETMRKVLQDLANTCKELPHPAPAPTPAPATAPEDAR